MLVTPELPALAREFESGMLELKSLIFFDIRTFLNMFVNFSIMS